MLSTDVIHTLFLIEQLIESIHTHANESKTHRFESSPSIPILNFPSAEQHNFMPHISIA